MVPTSPSTAAIAPPISIQIALSVGDPVNNLDTSELKELVACRPKIIRATPIINNATETILFIKAFGKATGKDSIYQAR
jgi:hypothetical protein